MLIIAHTLTCPAAETLLRNFSNSVYQCLSEETLKAVGPFYLVPGEVKDPTSSHWNV